MAGQIRNIRQSASTLTTCTGPSRSPAPTRVVSVRRRPRAARVPDFATLTLRPAAAPPGIKMHTLPMTMPHEHRRRTEEAHGHKHNSECKEIAEEECKADAECKWEADKCVTALSDTDHLDFHATYKYVVEEGGMCAATYAAAVASHSVAFPPREPYMQPRTPPALTTGFEAMRMTVDMFSGLTFENRRLTDAVTGREHLTAYLRALLPSRIDDDDVFDLNVLMLNVINGLVTPYVGDGFAEVHSAAWESGMPLDDVKFSEAFPKSIPGADGLESVFRALGVPPVDIDVLLAPEEPDELRLKYVSDFIAAMFADIQKGAVGQCDCETACAPLTSFQPDSFKTYYDQAVPPQWIWEGNEDTRSDEFPACRAIPVEGNADDGYTILDAEDAILDTDARVRTPGRLRVRRAPRRPRTDPHSPLAPGVPVPGRRRVPPDHDRHVRAPHADEGPPPVVQVLEGNERV